MLAQITSLNKKIQRINKKKLALKAELKNLNEDHMRLQAENMKLQANLPALSSMLDDKIKVISLLESTIQDLKSRFTKREVSKQNMNLDGDSDADDADEYVSQNDAEI